MLVAAHNGVIAPLHAAEFAALIGREIGAVVGLLHQTAGVVVVEHIDMIGNYGVCGFAQNDFRSAVAGYHGYRFLDIFKIGKSAAENKVGPDLYVIVLKVYFLFDIVAFCGVKRGDLHLGILFTAV